MTVYKSGLMAAGVGGGERVGGRGGWPHRESGAVPEIFVSVLYLKNSWIFEESHDKLQLVNVLYLRNSMIALKNSRAGITLLLKNDQVLGKAG